MTARDPNLAMACDWLDKLLRAGGGGDPFRAAAEALREALDAIAADPRSDAAFERLIAALQCYRAIVDAAAAGLLPRGAGAALSRANVLVVTLGKRRRARERMAARTGERMAARTGEGEGAGMPR